jgi:hypothetical protein
LQMKVRTHQPRQNRRDSCPLRLGDLVKKKSRQQFGIVFEILRSYEVDPMVRRFRILWHNRNSWECLDDLEVISESR